MVYCLEKITEILFIYSANKESPRTSDADVFNKIRRTVSHVYIAAYSKIQSHRVCSQFKMHRSQVTRQGYPIDVLRHFAVYPCISVRKLADITIVSVESAQKVTRLHKYNSFYNSSSNASSCASPSWLAELQNLSKYLF